MLVAMTHRRRARLALAAVSIAACRPKASVVTADASAAASATPSTADAAPEPSASAAPVPLADAPDVRVALPATNAVVMVGQTFGVLVPPPADFLDEWELEHSSLGEPLTFISRGDLGRELVWKIGEDKVGSHDVELRLMHRKTRSSAPTASKRARVAVDVVKP